MPGAPAIRLLKRQCGPGSSRPCGATQNGRQRATASRKSGLATLAICREWTTRQGDNSLLADLANWEKVALGRLEQDLWNGRYYRAYGSQNGRLNDNCHAGMLAGEYYARLLAGRDILPADRLEACATAWFELNGHDQFQIPPDEVGPDGGAGSEYGWLPYVESFGLAPLAVLRHPRVLPVWQRMVWHMAENGRRPCDTRLMYQPVTGEISWGSYYMTAPACWLVYDALLDFAFDAGPGVFRLAPQFDGRFALVHPRFWATGTQTTGQDGGTLTVEIVRVFGDGPLQIRALETIHPATPTGPLAAGPATREGAYARQPLQPINLTVGTTLTWHVPGQKT